MKKESIFKKEILVACFFVLLSIYATFPLVFKLKTHLYGYPYDSLVWLWHLWWLKYSWLKGISFTFVTIFSYPFGVPTPPLSWTWHFINQGLALMCGEVMAYNLQIMLSFFLAGISMYYLALRFVKNRLPAFFAGAAFALCPYHFARSWDHLSLANIHWMVFYVLVLFSLVKNKTYKMAVAGGICFGLIGHLSNFYYVYFMLLFSALFFIYRGLNHVLMRKEFDVKSVYKLIKLIGVMTAVAAVMIIPQVSGHLKNMIKPEEATKVVVRPFNQLFADSAKPLNYFLPAEYNPVIGRITLPFIGTIIYGDNAGGEQSLYLGLIPLFLCFIAAKRRKKKKEEFAGQTEENFACKFFGLAAIVFMITSFSPFWGVRGGFFIPFPSFILFKIFPMFRNYARLGIVVMMSVCVLSAFGMKYILEAIKSKKKKVLIFSLLMGLLLFEFASFSPFVDTTRVPEVYNWLKNEPEDKVIVEYPLEADSRWNLYYQRVHQKRMLNYIVPGTYAAEVQKKISDLEKDTTPGILKFQGVDYVLVHNDKYRAGEGGRVLGEVPEMSRQAGYILVRDFKEVKVYSIDAAPIDPKDVELADRMKIKKEPAAGLPPTIDAKFLFKKGDILNYTISYFGIFPMADCAFSIEEDSRHRKNFVSIQVRLKPRGLLLLMPDSRVRMGSLFNLKSMSSERYSEFYQVGKKRREKTARFDISGLVMSTADKKVKIEPYTQDPVSVLFFMASHDFWTGRRLTTYINPGKSNYRLDTEVTGKKTINIKGVPRKCWELSGNLFKMQDNPEKNWVLKIWFDDTQRHIPLKLETATKIGLLKMELSNYENKPGI